ncbi:AMP-binding protein, partial [Dactylosporangium sp. NPDC050588]|uniref:AMP-binding protein n=1 Tax=Dactylosporangium sp. NPDC050588 TaxID=3157211 RepID=UPI0033FFF3A9
MAYVVGAGEGLREHVAASLPEYMVPAAFVTLDALPLTVNGKLDRRALPAPQFQTGAGRGPANVHEELLCAAFAQVLDLDAVGVDDDFFALGGHSLLAVRLVEWLRERGVAVSVRALFETPSPAGLAATAGPVPVAVPGTLTDLTEDELRIVTAAVAEDDIADIYPLAPLQEGILFHHLLAGGGDDAYVLSTVLAFDGRARLDAFTAALQQVIDRHDVFRTSVVWEGLREPVQVVWRSATLPVVEVGSVDEVGRSMDLGRAPLLDVHVSPEADGRWLALVRVHHLVQDHTALDVVLGEIQAVLDGRPADLPEPVPFRNFVAQARATGGHEEHFRALLAGVDAPTVAFGVAGVHGDGSDVVTAHLGVEPALAHRLRDAARRLGASPATVMHVVWSRVLAAVSGRTDVVFGTVLLGRMNAGTGAERVPGAFINTLPVRVRTGDLDAAAAVAGMRRQLAGLLEHEHASLALAQRVSAVPADEPLFTTLFNYRHAGTGGPARTGGFEVLSARERTNYPLTVSVDDDGTGFTFAVDAAAPIDPHAVAAMLHTATAGLVAALSQDAAAPLATVDVLGEAERRQVLSEWNPAVDVTPAGTLVSVFAAQAAGTPAATALVDGDLRLSYADLDARSNRMARFLAGRGVGPESLVAVRMDRSADLVVALLGVLKAGAGYLPIDPAYPAERVAFMLADARPALVMSDLSDLPDDDSAVQVPGLLLDHPAYVIYTSGSTGTPKGVVVSHRNVMTLLAATAEQFAFGADDVWTWFHSFAF